MESRLERVSGPERLSVRQLTLIFIGAVGVSALFFALGFLVGSNGRAASAAPTVEQVSPPGEIPPTVNAPLQNSPTAGPATNPAPNAGSSVQEQNIKPQSAPAAEPLSTRKDSPAASPEPVQAPPRVVAASGGLTLQIAALRTRREALLLERQLRRRGFAAVLLTPQAGDHDRMYRVQTGPFSSRSQALAAQKKLRRAGFRSFIKQSR